MQLLIDEDRCRTSGSNRSELPQAGNEGGAGTASALPPQRSCPILPGTTPSDFTIRAHRERIGGKNMVK
jgi:hypothetical protein